MVLNQSKKKYFIVFCFFFVAKGAFGNEQLNKDPSMIFLSKVAASHFSMKHIHDIGYKEDKLTFDIGVRMNMSSKSELDKNVSSSVKGLVDSLVDSLGSIRSNFIEASVGRYKGLSFHFQTIPMLKFQSFTFTNMGFGVQWSYLDVIFEKMPISAAIKTYMNKTDIDDTEETLGYSSTMLGVVHLIGKEWKYFSLFWGLGYAKTDTSIQMKDVSPQVSLGGFHTNVSALFKYKYLRLGSEFSLIDNIKMISFKMAMVI